MTPRADVDSAVARVVDPCSDAMGLPLDVAEMGLVRRLDVDAEAGEVQLTLALTSPCCAYGPAMAAALEAELSALDWVHRVSVDIDHAAVWTPADMSPAASDRLGTARDRTLLLTGVRPYDWTAADAS